MCIYAKKKDVLHVINMSCSCERQKETIGNNYNELCPHCGAIIMSATITTSDTNYNYYENSKI